MCQIDNDKLIKAVRARPCLYDKNDEHYQLHSNKEYKEKMWRECCEIVFKNWEQLRPQQKLEHSLELKRRWKSLRTCFTRELSLIKNEEEYQKNSDIPIRKKKRYRYFKKLTFLLGDQREEENEYAEDEESTKDSSESEDQFTGVNFKVERMDEGDLEESVSSAYKIITSSRLHNKSTNLKNAKLDSVSEENPLPSTSFYKNENIEDKLLDLLKEKLENESDEDRLFLLSLVPLFKKMNDKQKLQARIELLDMIKRISYPE